MMTKMKSFKNFKTSFTKYFSYLLETQTFNVLHACIKALFLESISNNLIDWVKLYKYREKVWNLLRHILRIHTSFKALF